MDVVLLDATRIIPILFASSLYGGLCGNRTGRILFGGTRSSLWSLGDSPALLCGSWGSPLLNSGLGASLHRGGHWRSLICNRRIGLRYDWIGLGYCWCWTFLRFSFRGFGFWGRRFFWRHRGNRIWLDRCRRG